MLPFERIIRTPTRREELSDAFRLDWYGDRDVAVYRLFEQPASREEVDMLTDRVLRMIDQWPEDKPYLVIYVMVHAYFSPHGRRRAQEMFNHVPTGMHGRVAFVLPDNPIGHILKLFLRQQRTAEIEIKAFTRTTAAVAWVESYLDTLDFD